jgi:hypothetical protein
MKLRRLMQNCPSRTKPTKGQCCASQQNWPPNAAMGQSLHIDKPGASAQCPLCLRKRPNRCAAAKRRLVPLADSCSAAIGLSARWHWGEQAADSIGTARQVRLLRS